MVEISAQVLSIFYGASKGNPGVSGVGGLVFSPDRMSSFSFSWGLGTMSNNQAEIYSLLSATQLAKEKGFKSVQFFCDSEILIKALNSTECLNNSPLNIILWRIRRILKYFY